MPDTSVPHTENETSVDAPRAAWETPEVRRLSASASELNPGVSGDSEGVS
jgi:hypothetical protein